MAGWRTNCSFELVLFSKPVDPDHQIGLNHFKPVLHQGQR